MKHLKYLLFAGLFITGNALAIPTSNIIQGSICSTADVTATGYVNSDVCIGLLDKDQGVAGSGPNDSEDFLNTAQVFNDGSDLWGVEGAFGINTWDFLGKDEQTSQTFINATSGEPPTWSVDSALTGTFLIAVKQKNELGLWLFEDLMNVTDGQILLDNIFGGGITDDDWSHVSIYGTASNVPEPDMIALIAIGLLGMLAARRRMR